MVQSEGKSLPQESDEPNTDNEVCVDIIAKYGQSNFPKYLLQYPIKTHSNPLKKPHLDR